MRLGRFSMDFDELRLIVLLLIILAAIIFA